MGDNDKRLVDLIRQGDQKARYQAFKEIYSLAFQPIRKFVNTNNGTNDDAKDIFQESVLVLFRNILNDSFRGESSLTTYLYSIGRNLWLQQLKKAKADIISTNDFPDVAEGEYIQGIDLVALHRIIAELKDDCQKMLIGFYYDRKTMTDLKNIFHLGSEQAAKNKKLRCLEYLVKLVREREMTVESFLL